MADRKISILVTAVDKMSVPFKKMWSTMNDLSTRFSDFWKKHRDTFESMRNYGAIASASIIWVWLSFVKTSKNFQQYEVALGNAMWSQDEAIKSMEMINEIASKTPFQLEELTQSYITLVNRWFKPTQKEIIALWDIAASQWKNFDQLAEALLDATTWEFERLKEFWVRASSHWDQVSFTFKWVTTTVAKTDQAIKDYLISLGSMAWVSWWMEQQSKTLEGRLSTLKDTIQLTGKSIWDSLLPHLTPLIWHLTVLAEWVGKWVAQNPELSATILVVVWSLSLMLTVVWTLWLALPVLSTWLFTVATATWAVTVTVWALLWPIALLVVALGIRSYNINMLRKDWDLMVATLKWQTQSMIDTIKWKFEDISKRFKWYRDKLKWLFTEWRWWIGNVVNVLVDWIVDSVTGRFTRMFEFAKSIFDKVKTYLWWGSESAPTQSTPPNGGNRALWWKVYAWKEYTVWEHWREKIIPMTNWYVMPNKSWWSMWDMRVLEGATFNISNDIDLNNVINKIKNSIYRDIELYRKGVA